MNARHPSIHPHQYPTELKRTVATSHEGGIWAPHLGHYRYLEQYSVGPSEEFNASPLWTLASTPSTPLKFLNMKGVRQTWPPSFLAFFFPSLRLCSITTSHPSLLHYCFWGSGASCTVAVVPRNFKQLLHILLNQSMATLTSCPTWCIAFNWWTPLDGPTTDSEGRWMKRKLWSRMIRRMHMQIQLMDSMINSEFLFGWWEKWSSEWVK